MAPFAQVLAELGSFGHFQVQLLILLSVPSFLTAFYMFTQVCMVLDKAHYCSVTWVRNQTLNLSAAEHLALSLLLDAAGSPEPCLMFQLSPDGVSLEDILSHSFNETQLSHICLCPPHFNMVCGWKHLKETSQSVYVAGLLTGALIFRPLCNYSLLGLPLCNPRIGHTATLLVQLLLFAILGVSAAFVPSFELYMVLCFSVAAAITGYTFSNVTLLTWWVAPSWRIQAVVLAQCTFSLGQMALAGLIAGTAPVFLLFYFCAGPEVTAIPDPQGPPESARWLLTWGRGEEAKQLIQKVALVNRRKLSSELLSQILLAPEKTSPSGNALDLFQHPQLRKETLILFYIWTLELFGFVDSLVFYGLGLKLGDFGLNIYLTQLIFGAVEVPSQSGILVLGGLVCITIIFVPANTGTSAHTPVLPRPLVSFSGVRTSSTISACGACAGSGGEVCLGAGFTIFYVNSAELFPTAIRQMGMGLVSIFSRIRGILMPLMILLGKYHTSLFVLAVLSEKDLEALGSISSPGVAFRAALSSVTVSPKLDWQHQRAA
ncbi:hypothetical protein FD754_002734 [Muntiacus muntjak]|uniref:Major facilitator superfamily (MFS) profile domain-containing protein n=1 Tax=Muntiacus muntjak TaxID=9888 RepID=A0A5N3WCH5_MUNMU|nr:hypothetical protein FD754_002734 [Muntiacus muntjak]